MFQNTTRLLSSPSVWHLSRTWVSNHLEYVTIEVKHEIIGLLLTIVYLLVETTTNRNRMRAILSITILLTMICYNIKTRPCYVDKVTKEDAPFHIATDNMSTDQLFPDCIFQLYLVDICACGDFE